MTKVINWWHKLTPAEKMAALRLVLQAISLFAQ